MLALNKAKLHEYTECLQGLILSLKNDIHDYKIDLITNNSMKVQDNSIFVAIHGAVADGHKYIDDAISKGAKVIVFQNSIILNFKEDVVYIKVSDSYYAYSLLVAKYFDNPAEKLKLIGITGTNGKTTSAYLIYNILKYADKKVGLISTINYRYGDEILEASRTTPEAFELQYLFSEMLASGCEYVVMEVSSHALDQHRISNVKFKAALFTNLTGDHLDYHQTMENYFNAKKLLFDKYLMNDSVAVINEDDVYGRRLLNETENCSVKSYGANYNSDYKIILNDNSSNCCISGIEIDNKFVEFRSNLIGWYNAYNITGAFSICFEIGISIDIIVNAFSMQMNVPGRLEMVDSGTSIKYFVDYAHTDDALLRVLTAMKKLNPSNLIVVVGCGGDRDKSKRPRMGKVASMIADKIIITSDNPRTENPTEIIDDIMVGIDKSKNINVIENRKEAIIHAVNISRDKDIVIVAGKGHENYQDINGVKNHFSDVEILEEAIKNK
ncbi:MAG: UDP-N-acetylmuramoyl-L-alanyl-D-glutamate--2,6-diaminopimelate ligase [bacterium]|nr:UDP-N-acetylmuramoyl-L-alanyl-D-glutamate--2,6-diaminopimelate ligase [bacterium]